MSEDILIDELGAWSLALWTLDSSPDANFSILIDNICRWLPLASGMSGFVRLAIFRLSSIINLILFVQFSWPQSLVCVRGVSLAPARSSWLRHLDWLLKLTFTSKSVCTSAFYLGRRPLGIP